MQPDLDRYFTDHRVYPSSSVPALRWSKPGTRMNHVNYFIFGGTLFVSGDLGDAVYQWSEPVSFHWLAKTWYDYFCSKCQASDLGRNAREWDDQKAFDHALEHFSERLRDDDDVPIRLLSDGDYTPAQIKLRAVRAIRERSKELKDESASEILSGMKSAAWCREEWQEWVTGQLDDGWDHMESLGRAGDVLPLRQLLHHRGLQLAVAQLPADYVMPQIELWPAEPSPLMAPVRPVASVEAAKEERV